MPFKWTRIYLYFWKSHLYSNLSYKGWKLSLLNTFNIPKNQDRFKLLYLYSIPELHKNPYKRRCIAGSSKCSTKPLSLLLTKLLTAIEESPPRYCSTAYSRSGVNQMWILKNSKELLENSKSQGFSKIDSTITWFLHTLYNNSSQHVKI
jgi:hypothetical protein